MDISGSRDDADVAWRSALIGWERLMIEHLRRKTFTSSAEATVEVGRLLYQLGRHAEALQKFDEAIEQDNDRDQSYIDTIAFLVQNGETDAAVSTYRKALSSARDLDQVHIVLGFPSVGYGDRDYYPTLLLSTLLGGGMSSRLFQEVREKRGLVYSIYSFSSPFLDGGLFGIYAGTGESEAEELMPVTLAELVKVQTEVTETELARARAQVKASLLMSLESTGSRCEQLARQLQSLRR
jgi:tetratricopeptide (TPR) repeat protein